MFPRLVIGKPESAGGRNARGQSHPKGWPVRTSNRILASVLPDHYVEVDFILTRDVLKIARRAESPEEVLRQRWGQRGWSPSKIDRAIDDIRRSNPARLIHGLDDELLETIACIVRNDGPVFVFACDMPFHRDIKRRVKVTIDELRQNPLLIQMNTLVEVRCHHEDAVSAERVTTQHDEDELQP